MRSLARAAVTAFLVGSLALFAPSTGAQTSQTAAADQALQSPSAGKDAIRFAAFGDMGTGDRQQYEVAEQMTAAHERFPFEFVLMLGDNLYGGEGPQDFARKFEIPYKSLLEAGVKFYASLGNHDDPNQRLYKPFNMDGKRYYTFTKGPVQFFALDSNYMDKEQIGWLEKELDTSRAKWKICFFHHPLYSSGARHGAEVDLRNQLEPLFTKYGVHVVFSGHEHFYERIRPQRGIHYFISGAGGKLRKGNIKRTPFMAAGFDTDQSFMLLQIEDETMTFESISRKGERVDSGTIERPKESSSAGATRDEQTAEVTTPPLQP